jgi:Icc-related predicted phosphoesterase
LRIVAISDTHGSHRNVKLPDGDVLIHAGDFTVSYRGYDIAVIRDFDEWLGQQPHRRKVVVPGNHDRYFADYPLPARELIQNAEIKQDEVFAIGDLTFYMSPWTPKFHSDFWKFHRNRGSEMLQMWEKIPTGIDVLVTHGPPENILDLVDGVHAGDEMLRREVLQRVKPRVHIFGHIHPGYGTIPYGRTQFYNAALCDESYRIFNEPWVIDIEAKAVTGGKNETQVTERGSTDGTCVTQ